MDVLSVSQYDWCWPIPSMCISISIWRHHNKILSVRNILSGLQMRMFICKVVVTRISVHNWQYCLNKSAQQTVIWLDEHFDHGYQKPCGYPLRLLFSSLTTSSFVCYHIMTFPTGAVMTSSHDIWLASTADQVLSLLVINCLLYYKKKLWLVKVYYGIWMIFVST